MCQFGTFSKYKRLFTIVVRVFLFLKRFFLTNHSNLPFLKPIVEREYAKNYKAAFLNLIQMLMFFIINLSLKGFNFSMEEFQEMKKRVNSLSREERNYFLGKLFIIFDYLFIIYIFFRIIVINNIGTVNNFV